MKYRFYIGVDVSKSTLDVAIIDGQHKENIDHTRVDNSDSGIRDMVAWIQTKHKDFT